VAMPSGGTPSSAAPAGGIATAQVAQGVPGADGNVWRAIE